MPAEMPASFSGLLQALADVYARDVEAVRSDNAELRHELAQLRSAARAGDVAAGMQGSRDPADDEDKLHIRFDTMVDTPPTIVSRRTSRIETGNSLSRRPSRIDSISGSLPIMSRRPSRNETGPRSESKRRSNSIFTPTDMMQSRQVSDGSLVLIKESVRQSTVLDAASRRRRVRSNTVRNFKALATWVEMAPLTSLGGAKVQVTSRARTHALICAVASNSEIISTNYWMQRLIWHPGSYKRLLWDLVSMVLLAYDLAMIPFVSAFNPAQGQFLMGMTWGTLLFWTVDMFTSLITGYQTDRKTVLHPKHIALNYLRTWFIIDLMIVSLDWILVTIQGEMDTGGSAARLGRSLRTLRFVRTLRLIRLVKLKRIFQGIQDHLNTETLSICFGIMKIILFLLMANHIVACGWYGVGVWWSAEPDFPNWVAANDMESRKIMYQYTTSLHWSLTQFTPASMEIHPYNITERIYSVIVLLFAMLTFSSFVSILTASMAELRRIGNDESHKFWLLRRYLRDWKVSRGVTLRVVRYLEYAYQRQRQRVQETDVQLLRLLSEPLRQELAQELFAASLSLHPLFHICNRSVRFLTKAMQCQALARGDFVFGCGEEASCILFASSGTFEYVRGACSEETDSAATPVEEEEEGEYVLEGQWVSEAVLWTAWMHLGDLQAVTECQILSVNAEQFAKLVKTNKPLLAAVRRYAEGFLVELNKLEQHELTDLLHQHFSPQEIVEESELDKVNNFDEEEDLEPDDAFRIRIERLLNIFQRGRSKSNLETCGGMFSPTVSRGSNSSLTTMSNKSFPSKGSPSRRRLAGS